MDIHDRINGCIAVEKATADIYKIFLKLFPEEKSFWEDLYNEEIKHIESFRLGELLDLFGEAENDLPLPSMQYIRKTLEFTEHIKQKIAFETLSLEQALRLSLTLEETMVEIYMNEIKEMSRNSLPQEIEQILAEERTHVEKISQLMIEKGIMRES